jgi:hypothetical protein
LVAVTSSRSYGSTSATTTSIVHTERLGWNRPILPLLRPCSATLAEPECADATCLVDWFTSTNELHERFYAPYGAGDEVLGATAGALVLAAWVAVTLGASVLVITRRDA